MKRFILALAAVLIAMALASCGGGGGGGDKVAVTSFNVTITDHNTGFSNAGSVNLVILGTVGGFYQAQAVRAVQRSEIISDSLAYFPYALGRPTLVEPSGAGVFEIRVTQGVAGVWNSSDTYDRWRVGGHLYALGYGPPGSAVPGWSVWDADTTTRIDSLSHFGIPIDTYFISRSEGKPSPDEPSEKEMQAKMVAIVAKIR